MLISFSHPRAARKAESAQPTPGEPHAQEPEPHHMLPLLLPKEERAGERRSVLLESESLLKRVDARSLWGEGVGFALYSQPRAQSCSFQTLAAIGQRPSVPDAFSAGHGKAAAEIQTASPMRTTRRRVPPVSRAAPSRAGRRDSAPERR